MRDRVACSRGTTVESSHRVHVAVVTAEGELVARVGDPRRITFFRSAAKPLQALPLVEDGVVEAFGLTDEELALSTGSHNSEPLHVETARSLLRKAGVEESFLGCGPHRPLREETAEDLIREGVVLGAVHSNCSGKHAGMLALAEHHGWDLAGYLAPEHPVQERVVRELARWTGCPAEEFRKGIDGCGAPTWAVPLDRMAGAYARFTRAESSGGAARRIVEAMTVHPYFVAGTDRMCTAVMSTAGDRAFVKIGAEGVYCGGMRGRGLGVALKVEDGAWRANEAAMMHVLEQLDVFREGDLTELAAFRSPPIRNSLGQITGYVTARFELQFE